MKKSQKLDMSVPPKEDLSLIRHPHNYPLVFETMLIFKVPKSLEVLGARSQWPDL